MKQVLFIILFVFTAKAHAMGECAQSFIKLVDGELPQSITSNPKINMWSEEFDHSLMVKDIQGLKTYNEKIEYLESLSKFINNDEILNENLTSLVSKLYQDKTIAYKDIKSIFLGRELGKTTFSFSHRKGVLISMIDYDTEKKFLVDEILKRVNISKGMKKDYQTLFMKSKLTRDELGLMFESGFVFKKTKRDLDQLAEYLDFLAPMKAAKVKVGLKNVSKIYNYGYSFTLSPIEGYFQAPHKHFLAQKRRIEKYRVSREIEIQRGLKLQQRNGLVAEIDEAAEKEANGIRMKISEKLRFKKNLDDMELPSSLKKRAAHQARHESIIYKKLLRGCNSGSSKRITSAKKKFSRFKFALMMSMTPTFYTLKNKDKMGEDEFFWEKLGHEMAMNVMFTYVSNKLFTNTNTGFWRKYLEGYVKFGALGYTEAATYDALFGKKSYIRHLQKLYKKDVSESDLEIELEKLKNSPTFDEDMKGLMEYLEKMSKKKNTKNFIDKYFKLSAYSSLEDEFKITKEDLESEEAREVVMELLAERLYLENMGSWGLFQTGGKDTDRFTFYRARASFWDLKGIMLNLAIFEMMCREPFGKVGSWAVIISLIMGDNMLTGDLTYQYRRDAINQ